MDVFCCCVRQVVLVILEQTRGPWILSGVYASMEYKERIFGLRYLGLSHRACLLLSLEILTVLWGLMKKMDGKQFIDNFDSRSLSATWA